MTHHPTAQESMMPARTAALEALEIGLRDAALWGLELDTRYRVLAGTFEPTADHHPHGDAPDRRLQVVFFPCAAIKARLVKAAGGENPVLERFEVDQLVDVIERLDGALVKPPAFDQGEPAWDEVSLQGESTAPDGRAHDVTFLLEGNGRRLTVWATFDEVQVLDPEGEPVPMTLFRR